MTEREVKEKGIKYRVGKFPFTAAGKAVAIDHPEGFVKLIIDEKYGEIFGRAYHWSRRHRTNHRVRSRYERGNYRRGNSFQYSRSPYYE